ncbi:hypothetical protein M0R45_005376 [Rubus argutus]|uniref:Uncharacterized protein n=1 Tax=Rubus argutus TaxID=59490 RepID=A0AAW1YMG4_RUBAR
MVEKNSDASEGHDGEEDETTSSYRINDLPERRAFPCSLLLASGMSTLQVRASNRWTSSAPTSKSKFKHRILNLTNSV